MTSDNKICSKVTTLKKGKIQSAIFLSSIELAFFYLLFKRRPHHINEGEPKFISQFGSVGIFLFSFFTFEQLFLDAIKIVILKSDVGITGGRGVVAPFSGPNIFILLTGICFSYKKIRKDIFQMRNLVRRRRNLILVILVSFNGLAKLFNSETLQLWYVMTNYCKISMPELMSGRGE